MSCFLWITAPKFSYSFAVFNLIPFSSQISQIAFIHTQHTKEFGTVFGDLPHLRVCANAMRQLSALGAHQAPVPVENGSPVNGPVI